MSPSRLFILRPVATTLLMVGVLLVGWVAFMQLPVSALPEVDYPTIQVVTFYPGADPEVMASSVTSPLERQFGQVPGLSQMTSTSSFGSSVITLQFGLDQNIDVEEQQVQAAINSGSTYLPTDLPNPPIYNKVNPADAPILTLALTSDSLPLSKVEDLADTSLAQKISQLPGVGLVSISGGQKPAVRIQANPTALASYGLSLEDLRAALAQANVDQAKGVIDGTRQSYTIGANDQLFSSDQYKPIVIAYRNSAPVRVSDVANVIDGTENNRLAAWMNLTPAVIVNIQRQPGANIISVVDRIKKLLPQLQASLPQAVKVQILTDRTTTIRASVKDVEFELMLAIGLVVMVVFLFLRNLSATVIPSVAVPLSLIGTFGVMYLLGLQLEQPDANGADYLHRVRGRRRHRHDRKHRPLPRSRRLSAGSGSERIRADRIHDRLADRLADRGADSAAVHGRHCGPAVPRVCGYAGGDDSGFGGSFADPDADDVRQAAQASQRRREGPLLRSHRRLLQPDHCVLWPHGEVGAEAPNRNAAGNVRNPGSDAGSLRDCAEGLFPGAGYGRDSGRVGSAGFHLF